MRELPNIPTYQIGPENIVFVVILEDPPSHTREHPFCAGGDPNCPCREDRNLVREFIDKPMDNGLLTGSEAVRLYFGRQV